jgi:threonine 3-dehydrogenase
MPRTYLITGGAGNVACRLTFELAADAAKIILVDRAERPLSATAPGCAFECADLTEPGRPESLVARHKPDVIIHLAAMLSGASEADRRAAWAVNADATFALLEGALAAGCRGFFFTSTLGTYGKVPDPLPEDFPQWPTGIYGVTKVAGERLGVYYHEKHGLDFRGVRLPVLVSPDANPGAASAYASRVFVEAARNGRYVFAVRPTTRVSTLYVRDAVEGIAKLVRAPAAKLSRRMYNLHGIAPTAREIADAAQARLPKADIRFDPKPEVVALIESWPAVMEDASARRDWGWSARFELPAMADDMVRELSG